MQEEILSIEKENDEERSLLDRKYMKPMSKSDFKKLHDSIFISKWNKKGGINFFLKEQKNFQLMEKVRKRLPNCSFFEMNSVSETHEGIQEFLVNYFPNKVNEFIFISSLPNADVRKYIDQIVLLSGSVTREFSLSRFDIGQKDLVRIFKAYKHTESMALHS